MESPRRVEFYYLPKVMYFALLPLRREAFPLSCNAKPGQAGGFRYRIGSICQIHPEIRPKRLGYYARYDLMTAYSRPTTGANPAERVLDLDFRHQHAVFVFIPTTGMFCLPPDGDEDAYTYIGDVRVSVTDTKVTSVSVYDYGWGEVQTLQDGRWKLPTAYIHCKAGQCYYYPNWNIHYHK